MYVLYVLHVFYVMCVLYRPHVLHVMYVLHVLYARQFLPLKPQKRSSPGPAIVQRWLDRVLVIQTGVRPTAAYLLIVFSIHSAT